VQSGDLLVIVVRANNGTGVSIAGVSDNANGQWNSANTSAAVTAIPDTAFQLWYYPNSAASASLTITVTASSSSTIDISGQDWSGIATSSPLDGAIPANNSVTATGASYQSPSITTVNVNDLVIAWAGGADTNTWFANQSFTINSGNPTGNTQMAYFLAPTAGTYSTAFGNTANATTGTAGIVAFRTAGSVLISVSPPTVSLAPAQTQQFSAPVTGSPNTAVTWSISPQVGTISPAGLYTAPSLFSLLQTTVTVTAQAAANAGATATATVTLIPAVSLSPLSVTLQPNQTQQFLATVTGLLNNAVTWSISPQVGTISSAGLYTAPATISGPQTIIVTATSQLTNTLLATAMVSLQFQTLGTFQLSELFGVGWPDQPIEFRYDGGQPPAGTRMMLFNGSSSSEVPYQWVSSCSDATATKGCITVRSSLPANSSYTWTLQTTAPAANQTNPVQLATVGSNYEITNGLTGVRIVTPGANPTPSFNLAPIQGIRLADGSWTGAGASPNLLYSENQASAGAAGVALQTPMYTVTGYNVTVVDRGPMKTVLKVSYTFNRPRYFYSTTINSAGTGHYTLIITLYANSKSVLIDEDSDMQFSYFLPLYAQVQPDQARYRGHDAISSQPSPICGYETPLPVNGATNTSPIVISTQAVAGSTALSNGQVVLISGVAGNTAANGTYYVGTTGYAVGQFALYSDSLLTQPIAGNGAYGGKGVVKPAYRGQNLNPDPDAYLDLTYASDRPASGICSAGFYRKILAAYPSAAHAAGWYEEMYNSTGGPTAPVVGFYTGHGSLQSYSATGPSLPGPYTSNSHFITHGQAAGIQVDNLLRGGDGSTTTLVHRNWGIFVSTEADLLPVASHQPIATEQFGLTAIDLSRLYSYQLVYPDPPGGWQWEYLSPGGANQLISLVQNGTSVCGTPTCYYQLLKNSEGSPAGVTILNMWQGNNTAAVQTALNSVTSVAQVIVQTLANGDNRFDDTLGYYQLGLVTSPETAVLNAIIMNPNATLAQRTTAKATLALFGSIFWDDDWFPIDNTTGEGEGLANQVQQYLEYRTQSAAAAPSQPFLSQTVSTAVTYPENDFNTYFDSTGAAAGSTHYQSAFFEPLLLNFQNFSLNGIAINGLTPAMSDPKWAAYANWELSIQTPPEPRFGGSTNPALGRPLRKGYSNGDGNTEADVRTGMLGTAIYPVNPSLGSKLMWAWQQSNSATLLTEDEQFVTTLATIDPTIPAIAPQMSSINIPGYHSVERYNFGTQNETALWFINGGFYQVGGHRHADDGQVSIYAHAAPLAIDWNANLYSPETPGRFVHDSIVFDDELTHLWSADNASVSDASVLMQNPTNTEFAAFGFSTTSTGTFTYYQDSPTVWARTVRMMNFDPSYPVIYVADSFSGSGPGVAAGKTLTWNLMATGAVNTPVGPITPTTRFSSGCQSPAGQLPSSGTVSALQPGLSEFSFTGFPWPKNAAGGINWDLYTMTSTATQQFMIGNWGHGCQSNREMGEYQTANGAPFAEVQDILRVHGSGSFTTIILPYEKTQTPTRTVSQQACGVQIVQGAEVTCFNNSMATYSKAPQHILTVYDGSTQTALGMTASGGPQEVAIQPNSPTSEQITWTIGGVESGTRSVTLPGNWYPNQPVSRSGNTYSYSYSGGQQASPVTILFSQVPWP
jgi:hypothetical protein